MSASTLPNAPRPVMTVLGPIPYEQLGITDAHNHLWIESIPGAGVGSPVLEQFDPILKDLIEYRKKGGGAILDCQPGGCGRDGNQLVTLSRASQVHLIASTGFHRKKYYAQDYWLWSASSQQIGDYLRSELEQGLEETRQASHPCQAGFIKIALEATWADCPMEALEGTAMAANLTKALIAIHTEKGALAEKICIYLINQGVSPTQLVLCHMDKRPDVSLHIALARLGVLLEYDTFYRPKYNPTANLWRLIDQLVSEGLTDRIALATDMAEAVLYHNIGGGPGLASLPGEIQDQLKARGISEIARKQMLGGNITRRLAGII